MSDNSVRNKAVDFVRRLNVEKHEVQLVMVTEVFELGQRLEEENKDKIEQIKLLQHRNNEAQGAVSELRHEISELKLETARLQTNLGICQHQLSEYQSLKVASQDKQTKTIFSAGSLTPSNATSDTTQSHPIDLHTSCSSNYPRLSEIYKIDDKFLGNDKTLYPAFQRHIRIALAQNADRYTSLQSQISLIYQNLGADPQSFLDQFLGRDGIFTFSSVQDVWDTLDVSYRNPNEEEEARSILNTLKQKDRSYGSYLAEFQKFRILSCITDDGTLISFMRAGVSREMRSRISSQQDVNKKYTYNEFVALCKECQLRIDLDRPYYQDKNPTRSAKLNTSPPAIRNAAAFDNLSSINQPASIHGPTSPTNDPMILDAARVDYIGPDGKLTKAERDRRHRLNLCMRCGKPGHRALTCKPNLRIKELFLGEELENESQVREKA